MSRAVDPSFLEGLARLSEAILEPIKATVVGHRARLEAAGFSPSASEQAAVTLHHALIVQAFDLNLGGSQPCPTCRSQTSPPATPE